VKGGNHSAFLLLKGGNMQLTAEFLKERAEQFRLKVLQLKDELVRFEAVEEYTNGLIEYLEKEEVKPEVPVEAVS
jgi:hypothetical protein